MKRIFYISCSISIFILAFSFYFQIYPVFHQIQAAQAEQNHLQIKWQKQKYQTLNKPSVTSTAFYNWLNAQHLPDLTLVSLVKTSQGVRLVVSGSKLSIEKFLDLAQGSLFFSLNLSQLNSEKIKLDGVFTSLQLATNTQSIAGSVQSKHVTSVVVGVVHQNGLQFCVMRDAEGVNLVRKDQC